MRTLTLALFALTAACSGTHMPAPAGDAGPLPMADAAIPEYPDGGEVDWALPTCEETVVDQERGYTWPADCATPTSCAERGCTGCLWWTGAGAPSNLIGTCL